MSQPPSSYTPDSADAFFPDFVPVPMQRRRADGWTQDAQRLFIAMLAQTGSVRDAARGVGMSARSAYRLRGKPGADEFDLVWQAALDVRHERVGAALAEDWRGIAGGNWRAEERALMSALRLMPKPRDRARVEAALQNRAIWRDHRAEKSKACRAETARTRKQAASDARWFADRAALARQSAGPHVRPL